MLMLESVAVQQQCTCAPPTRTGSSGPRMDLPTSNISLPVASRHHYCELRHHEIEVGASRNSHDNQRPRLSGSSRESWNRLNRRNIEIDVESMH